MKEAEQLATGLRANGKKIGEHLQEFAMLAKKVSTTMRDTRAEVLNPPVEKMCPEAIAPVEKELLEPSNSARRQT
jgi:hypothetical protein